jgi:hypothetical protein
VVWVLFLCIKIQVTAKIVSKMLIAMVGPHLKWSLDIGDLIFNLRRLFNVFTSRHVLVVYYNQITKKKKPRIFHYAIMDMEGIYVINVWISMVHNTLDQELVNVKFVHQRQIILLRLFLFSRLLLLELLLSLLQICP